MSVVCCTLVLVESVVAGRCVCLLLLVVCRSLCVACCLCLLFAGFCVLLVVRCPLCGVRRLLFCCCFVVDYRCRRLLVFCWCSVCLCVACCCYLALLVGVVRCLLFVVCFLCCSRIAVWCVVFVIG